MNELTSAQVVALFDAALNEPGETDETPKQELPPAKASPLIIEPLAAKTADRVRRMGRPYGREGGSYWDKNSLAELLCQIEIQAALNASREADRDGIMRAVVAAFEKADTRCAIEVERGSYDAGTALAVLHELRHCFGQIAPAMMDILVPRVTENAVRVVGNFPGVQG